MFSFRALPRLAAFAVALTAAAAVASDAPPAGAKPLSQILDAAQKSHAGVIVSAEFDSGRWEVVVCNERGRRCREIHLHPQSAQVLRSRREASFDDPPPAGGKTTAEIAPAFDDRNLGPIQEIEFDDPVSEVKIGNGLSRTRFDVDPMTGETQRCLGRGCPPR